MCVCEREREGERAREREERERERGGDRQKICERGSRDRKPKYRDATTEKILHC